MPTPRKTASKAKSTARTTRVKAPTLPEPGTVTHRELATDLEARVASLEQIIDLLLIRVAVTESTAQTGLYRISQIQSRDTQDLLGL